jgi:hypothetical protein
MHIDGCFVSLMFPIKGVHTTTDIEGGNRQRAEFSVFGKPDLTGKLSCQYKPNIKSEYAGAGEYYGHQAWLAARGESTTGR